MSFHTGGCGTCHTAENGGAFLAGGRELKTDFGSFFTPNITPDPDTGIGGWSDEDFVRALRRGVSPDGDDYYPTFPYTSYARMTREDAVDLKAYLDSLPAVRNEAPDHDLAFPFSIRMSMIGWKLLFFDDDPFEPDASKSEAWNRGAYLVNGPRALRRMPHAAQPSRRREHQQISWRQQERARGRSGSQHHARQEAA